MKHLLATTLCALLLLGCSDDDPGGTGGATSASAAASQGGAGGSGAAATGGGGSSSEAGGSGGTGGVGGAGGSGGATEAYPPGPYGLEVGDVIPNLELQGFVDSTTAKVPATIRLEDFYNPSGNGTYPGDSQYGAGAPRPKALLLNLETRWALPCDFEAAEVLPPRYLQYAPGGGQFLLVLVEGAVVGAPADAADLVAWTTKHSIAYPATVDLTATLQPMLEAYPTNLVIDPRTMVITEHWLGVAEDEVWAAFEDLLGP